MRIRSFCGTWLAGGVLAAISLGLAGETAQNVPPKVAILSPANEAVFVAPAAVAIAAHAADTDGAVRVVEFFANDRSLGVTVNDPVRNVFTLLWTEAPAGSYVLTAKATDEQGATGMSAPVKIVVRAGGELPVITVVATDPEAAEATGVPGQPDHGVFTLTRTGDAREPLTVNFILAGTAVNGIDYALIETSATFAAGAGTREIYIKPVADKALEGTETVVLALKANAAYKVGSPSEARVVIADSGPPPEAAQVTITEPANGAVFQAPAVIEISAVTIDPKGYMPCVEFFADGQLLGASQIVFIRAPDPGTPICLTYTWKDAPVGDHVLVAKAKDSADATVLSPAVNVRVEGEPNRIVVNIHATDPKASEEPASNGEVDTATFTIKRAGRMDIALPVYYALSGSASNGEDYEELAGEITIPAGAESASLVVRPIDDSLVEGEEMVVVTLRPPICIEIYPPPPECYVVGTDSQAKAFICDRDQVGNQPPTVRLVAPANGATFEVPANIVLVAHAGDPDGRETVKTVEFFAGERSLGVTTNRPVMNPLGPFVLEWADVPVGSYSLTARATDEQGATAVSERVLITVVDKPTLPVVTVEATDSEAIEPAGLRIEPNTGLFTLTRTGDVRAELQVFYEVGGTALNGTDYARLDGQAVFAPGAEVCKVYVLPLADRLAEDKETVVLGLNPGEAYVIGAPNEAAVAILDAAPTPPAATLKITKPVEGASYTAPATVEISATAVDPKGYISRVEFYAGDDLIGVSELAFYVAPPAGSPIVHTLVWKDAPAGAYQLWAKAKDTAGIEVVSARVAIKVTPASTPAFVQRDLPGVYVPGVAFTVKLEAVPPAGTLAYAAEDSPPTGWPVTDISHEGAFDASNGKVKFGPFTDDQARTLSYTVTPPLDARGLKEFAGAASLAGVTTRIRGDRVVQPAGQRHPADRNPADDRLTMTEVSGYAAAWKGAESWPVAPNPIPLDYVTRAGALWKGGESYRYDPSAGEPPLCWVNVDRGQEGGSGGSDAPWNPIEPFPMPPVPGFAVRELPARIAPETPVTVAVRVTPMQSSAAFAVEEQPPIGWQISNVSDEGVVEAATGTIRWGLFYDTAPRVLTYQVTRQAEAAGLAAFSGAASFDGRTVGIIGPEQVFAVGSDGKMAWPGLERLASGEVKLNLNAESGLTYVIEVSSDLVNWTPAATAVGADELLSFIDAEAKDQPRRFYRAVPVR